MPHRKWHFRTPPLARAARYFAVAVLAASAVAFAASSGSVSWSGWKMNVTSFCGTWCPFGGESPARVAQNAMAQWSAYGSSKKSGPDPILWTG